LLHIEGRLGLVEAWRLHAELSASVLLTPALEPAQLSSPKAFLRNLRSSEAMFS